MKFKRYLTIYGALWRMSKKQPERFSHSGFALTPSLSHRMGEGGRRPGEGWWPSTRTHIAIDLPITFCF
jgi:hypothetical protein